MTYVTRFQWDMAKYPIKQSLKNISEIIAKVCSVSLLLFHVSIVANYQVKSFAGTYTQRL